MMKPKSRIVLVSMPFASLAIPSIAITQLKSVLELRFQDQVEVETLYLNHDFALYLGDLDAYRHVLANEGFMTGIGDWFFRQSAFPEAPDNTAEYRERYYARVDESARRAWDTLLEKRSGVDAFLDDMIGRHHLAEADIVGFTALFAQTMGSFALARRLKRVTPCPLIAMGGAACTGEMGLEFSRWAGQVDYFFSGPALVSFPEFVRRYREGGGLNAIKGVFPTTGVGRGSVPGVSSADRRGSAYSDDLDINTNIKLDYDAFLDSVEHHFPAGEIKPILLFETSRGCWWGEHQRCTFCGLNGPSLCFREMTPEHAVEQIRSLFRYASRCSFIESVDTVLPRGYLEKVLPVLETPPGMKIQYEVRATLREPELQVLCDAGVTVLQPGIESLSSETLKLMHKGTTVFQNIRFLKACARHPVTVGWNLLIFSPGEPETTYERYLRLIPLLTHLHPPQSACLVGFVRYSEYYEHAREYGLELKPEDFYQLTFPFDGEAIPNVAVKFYDARADVTHMEHWLGRLNTAVGQWRSRWLNQDRREESRLCLVEDGGRSIIYDSRSGIPVQHDVTPAMLGLVKYLEMVRTQDDIARDWPTLDVAGQLSWLRERGLVVEEDQRVMGLTIL